MSKTDHGNIELTLNGELYTLAFTLKAVKRIERFMGGILPAMGEVQKCNLTACAQIIISGAGLALKPSDVDALEEAIYQDGIITVTPVLTDYLSALLNPAAKTAEQQAEAEAKAEAAGTTVKK